MRLFRSTALGQREKAKRNSYIDGMVNRSFDRMLPPIDLDGLKNRLQEAIDLKAKTEAKQRENKTTSKPVIENQNLINKITFILSRPV